jgi:hypothetical protein
MMGRICPPGGEHGLYFIGFSLERRLTARMDGVLTKESSL